MSAGSKEEERVTAVLAQIERFKRGEFGQSLVVPDGSGDFDCIASALNGLGDVLRRRQEGMEKKEARIERLLDILLKYTVFDFSERAPIGEEGDEIDALAVGLNSLAEEVIDHIDKLGEREAQIQTIFTNAPDAVVAINRHGVIVRWNPAATVVFGWGKEQTIG